MPTVNERFFVAMQFHKWYSSPTIPYIDMNHISSFTTFETLQNQAGRICLMILAHQLEHRVRDKGRNACAMPAFQSGPSYNFDLLELMEAGSKAELTYRSGQATKPGSARLFPAQFHQLGSFSRSGSNTSSRHKLDIIHEQIRARKRNATLKYNQYNLQLLPAGLGDSWSGLG